MGLLEGKTALVTGGSSGIGLASAVRLAAEGAHVFITGRRSTELDEAVEAIGSAAAAVTGDISNPADLDRLYETIRCRGQGLDVLFANASVAELGTLEEVTEEHFDTLFGINVRGTVFTVKKALPLLNDSASVILNGSTNVDVGDEALGVYAATKAATRSFARTWANELKGRGIRVNTVTPGPTDTPALSALTPDPERFQRQLAARVPLGRLGRPEEVAAAVAFLASEQSSFITGSSLYVDGGLNQI
ncbi:NAD(P)-dependent dehydrogenase (short-subunit alcohol dehydrogenase family) [Streptomyces phaeochromogenes]|uniref:SDR family NAD(P)-dependent oxidoreductase n=1 Tax=Streptomyces phaeochromogenes TaxID=1923 RepID=UPI0027915989|nr:SDR family oxidoreductase [Streptomyces phaeochromogenes]MDQ0949685.1 NAD(P)-dependent dehydrogenase (short-subunit alcohol dehydrogenase family) [Streptomyces phaeochromogenes]